MTFIVIPGTVILLFAWLISGRSIFGKLIGIGWFGVIGVVFLSLIVHPLFSPMRVDKAEIYGSYIIDRGMFAGDQADWQYDQFRFEILPSDSIHFHETDGEDILRTFKSGIHFVEGYSSPRMVIDADPSIHHILTSSPTLFRSTWSFYYVFHSPKFHNVFFRKGE